MIRHLRRNGAHRLTAIALMAFMFPGNSYASRPDAPVADERPIAEASPVVDQSDKIALSDRILEIQSSIGDMDDPVLRDTYQSIGQGEASYYGRELAGNRTASGERFNPAALTAAHRSLPMGTKLRVTNISNGMSVIVRVNDRGPFVRSRIIDVSLEAARQIRMIGSGKAQVRLEILRTIA
jgi:rare lipoprotein A